MLVALFYHSHQHSIYTAEQQAIHLPSTNLSANTLCEVRYGSARASNALECNDSIIPKDLVLRQEVEVVRVAVIVRSADFGAPLLVAVVRAEIRDHDDYRLAGIATSAAGRTRRSAGRG